jgi:hypothetical protein
MNSGNGPRAQTGNADDAKLILAIFVLLWSRRLHAALRCMTRHQSSHTNTSARQLDVPPAIRSSASDHAFTDAATNPSPEGR